MGRDELVHRAVEAFNRRDAEAWAACYSEDAVMYDPFFPEPTQGREQIRAMAGGIWGAFSDVHWSVPRPVIVAGDRQAFLVDVTMTHDGPLPLPDGSSLPATAERIAYQTGVFWAVDGDGLVTEERAYFDATAVAAQLGLVG